MYLIKVSIFQKNIFNERIHFTCMLIPLDSAELERRHREGNRKMIVSKIQEKHPEAFEREGKVQMTALKVFEYLTEVMRDLPAIIVRTLKYFIKKVDFSSLFLEAVNSDTEVGRNETKAERVALVISNMIPADVISPNIKLPLFVLVLNCSMFFV